FLGFWFVAQCLLPPEPPLSVDRWLSRGNAEWRMPNDVTRVLWIVTGAAYTYSGCAKLASPSWIGGRSISLLLASPLARDAALVDAARGMPGVLLSGVTLGVLVLELAYLPLALWPRARPLLWGATMAMHVGIAATMNIADISIGMLAFHAMLFD